MRARRISVLSVGLAAYLISTVAGCGGSSAYSSPQATFDTAKAAAGKEDWKGFCQCLTPESRDVMAGEMAMMGVMMQGFAGLGGEAGKKSAEKIGEVLKKHGLDEKSMEAVKVEPEESKDPKKAMDKMLTPVKDRDAFIGDMFTALKSMDEGKGKEQKPLPEDAQLKDVKIDGDTATGTITAKKDGEDKSLPVKFKKIEGKWKLDFDPMASKPT